MRRLQGAPDSVAETASWLQTWVPLIEGPWAFIWWQAATRTLWFARDPRGRRSLLTLSHRDGVVVSSVSVADATAEDGRLPSSTRGRDTDTDTTGWLELPPGSIRCAVTVGGHADVPTDATCVRRCPCAAVWQLPLLGHSVPLAVEEGRVVLEPAPATRDLAARALLWRLADAVAVRVATIPPPTAPGAARVAVLFSGGIDSMVVAALAHFFVPAAEPIDLINVCFAADHASPDRVTACCGVVELRKVFRSRCVDARACSWRVVPADVKRSRPLQHACMHCSQRVAPLPRGCAV